MQNTKFPSWSQVGSEQMRAIKAAYLLAGKPSVGQVAKEAEIRTEAVRNILSGSLSTYRLSRGKVFRALKCIYQTAKAISNVDGEREVLLGKKPSIKRDSQTARRRSGIGAVSSTQHHSLVANASGGVGTGSKTRSTSVGVLDELLGLTPRDFERFIGGLIIHLGYASATHVRLAPKGADGGVDVYVYADALRTQLTMIVQAKRYTNQKVSAEVVDALYGNCARHGVNKAVAITTAGFTAEAIKRGGNVVSCIDGRQLADVVTASSLGIQRIMAMAPHQD